MPSSCDEDLVTLLDPTKKRVKKPMNIGASELIPGTNILEPPKKRYKKAGLETPDSSEFDDAASRISNESKVCLFYFICDATSRLFCHLTYATNLLLRDLMEHCEIKIFSYKKNIFLIMEVISAIIIIETK